ncbi:signal peptidase II [Nocardioides sp. cx-169]|uniref:signal peptidase II n=1 Tax=Nocardioides sp. cx-169 TaxID=2899080 RepID=UPI001E509AE3|nr:signal peptidase II [Nocardioides sp. cx-169]MCD4534774.1 signal peptidase II [Nocardioides sp. cx-169]
MQAARGTSLSDDTTSQPAHQDPRRRRRLWARFAAVALVFYAIDVVSKIVAVDRLTGREDIPVVGDLLVLHLTRNPGAAFSTGTEFTEVLSCIAIAAVGIVLWLSRRLGSAGWAFGLGLLLAGVAGNLTDRLLREPGPLRGHVIDFLMLPNWPVFNIADMCINVAAGVILIQAFRGVRVDGTRESREHDDPETQEPTE